MGIALLVEYYNELPQRNEGEAPTVGVPRLRKALDSFKQRVAARYNEGTLQRLLASSDARARQAAVLALGMVGGMKSNKPLSIMLKDEDAMVRQLAADALWSLWFRADSKESNHELQRLLRIGHPQKTLSGLDALIKKSPRFAEAYNQRAIIYFRLEEYQKSIADCEVVLRLNPCHFGAQAGIAQCYMKLQKPRQALKAFRIAFRMNPGMDGVEDTIRALEEVLGEEGRRDDKKREQ